MAKEKKAKNNNPYSLKNAIVHGDATTKLSMLIMGIGLMAHKQVVKGVIVLILEVAYIFFMIRTGAHQISMLPSLGTAEREKIVENGLVRYTQGDNSLLILLYGIASLLITLALVVLWILQMKQSYKCQVLMENGKHVPNFREDLASLKDGNVHMSLMFLPCVGILTFNVLPLIYMICMAFTDYSKEGNKLILFDWVGLKNFGRVLNFQGSIGREFWGVLAWTIIWAIFATALNYILGMVLALIINRRDTKIKGFWRFCFILSIAIPQFVSLLIMQTMLKEQGAVNVILQNAGIISSPLPFLTDVLWARVTVIVINLWVGIPYTMLQVTGILQNIPTDLFEAAKVDGANSWQIFWKITLPYMLFVTMPYLITSFTGNINNFNVIYLLTGGAPQRVGETAGKTDLLITWLYKLTIDQQYYNIGAVIGIFTFVVLAIVALVTYRNSGSYKNEEAFM